MQNNMYKLVNDEGTEIQTGATLTDFRGEVAQLLWFAYRGAGSDGRVNVLVNPFTDDWYEMESFPSVYGLKIVSAQE